MEELEEIYLEFEDKVKKTVAAMKREFASLRAGRANPSMVEGLEVEYYGTPTPLKQLASISVPEPRLIVIQPWDKSCIKDVEKAILKSELSLTPNNDGSVIRLNIPPLTEERRQELVKFVRKKAEEGRVAVRNLRRDVNDRLKKMEKESEISEDMYYSAQEKIQKMTDEHINELDKIAEAKEKEIMED